MSDLEKALAKLCDASRRSYAEPYPELEWPEKLPMDQWHFSPELISLYGSERYAAMSEPERFRLGFIETVTFYSLGIHNEKLFVEGAVRRLYERRCLDITDYLYHFLDEENKHMTYFGNFCLKYAGKIYPERASYPIVRSYEEEGEEDFLFFSSVLIAEEISDVYNVLMANDPRLSRLARDINRLHHRDETRHLHFGRLYVKELFDRHAGRWTPKTLANVREYLLNWFARSWLKYYSPEIYREAGMATPEAISAEVYKSAEAVAHRRKISQPIRTYFKEAGILDIPEE